MNLVQYIEYKAALITAEMKTDVNLEIITETACTFHSKPIGQLYTENTAEMHQNGLNSFISFH